MPISACITRELTALLENFFASPEAFGKSNLGNHSKFPLYLKTKWFKWKVPLEHTLRVSRSETDLPRHVHWSWGHCWVPPWHPCSPACPLSLLDLMHTAPSADREYGGVCRPTVHTQGILCARKICSHLQIMSFSLHGCISSSSEVWEDLLIEQQTSSYNLILLFLPFYHFFSHVPLSTGSDKWRLEDTLGTCSKQSQPRLCRTLWTEKPQALQG